MLPGGDSYPAHHALRRDAQSLADRVQRQARAIEADRLPLHRGRLAARGGAGELPAAALAAPALPAAGVAGLDQPAPAARRASFRPLHHARSQLVASHALQLGSAVSSVKPPAPTSSPSPSATPPKCR